jgi:hypothetical protein
MPNVFHRADVRPSTAHPIGFLSTTDPSLDGGNNVTAAKAWLKVDSTTAPTWFEMWERNAGNTAWIQLTPRLRQPTVGVLAIQFGTGQSALLAGMKVSFVTDFDLSLTSATFWSPLGQTGSAVADIWVDLWTNGLPTVADTITAAAKPTIAAGTENLNTTLTGWTVAHTGRRRWIVNLDSVSGFDSLALTLEFSRT